MSNKVSLVVGGVVVIAAVAAGAYYFNHQEGKAPEAMKTATAPMAPRNFAYDAMPVGITLQPLGTPQGYGAQRLLFPVRREIVYADSKGLTLYTYDKDAPGKSNCTADCAQTWVPAAPLANAKSAGEWTIVARDDGSKQWAINGKPVYTFVKDKEGGDVGGAASGGGGMMGYGSAAVTGGALPEGWHTALFVTGTVPVTPHVTPPLGIAIKEVTDANAVVFIDSRSMSIYAYDGSVDDDKLTCGTAAAPASCTNRFLPLAAPQMAHPGGDWSLISRKDGIEQWAYKGQPLYTYDADLTVGDVNGIGVDKRWHVAAVQSYFMPANVVIRNNPGRGRILATPTGMTLYRRDATAWSNSARQLVHDIPYRPRVGRMIRDKQCDAECQKVWHPYMAPNDAQPVGYWGVAMLPDGKKAWTYKDFVLFTYDGDKKAGDMIGDGIYDLVVSEDPNKVNDVGFPMQGPASLFWTFASL